MRNLVPSFRILGLGVVVCLVHVTPARADGVAQTLPFSQDWSNPALITVNDSWTGVPGIEGFRGDGLTGATGTDPQTLLAADDPGVLDVNANQTNPSTFATGGVAEFDLADDAVALNGSGTADAPYLRIYLNTTGQSNVTVRYNLRDLDGSVDNSIQQVALHYRVGSSGGWTNVAAAYVADASTGPSLATLVTPVCVVLPAAVENQAAVQLRVMTSNAVGNDEWIGVDDLIVDTAGCGGGLPTLSIDDVAVTEGDAGPVVATFTVSLSAPAGAGGVSFDLATQDGTATTANNDYVARSLTGQTIASGNSSYSFDVTVNGDTAPEPDETFLVNVANVTGATPLDVQGEGTIENDDLFFIHDVQGPGATTPLSGSTVTVEGVVVGDYQATDLRGFFLEEEDADFDANPATSEGIFVYCNTCPTAVAEGQRALVTGVVSEFFGMTEITATTAGDVVVTEAGNHLAEVTPAPIDLPVATPTIDEFYEPLEGMRVAFVDPLVVSEQFGMARFGTVELAEGSRPIQFTQVSAPSVPGYAAHLDALARRTILLDDDGNAQNAPLALPDGSQFVFHPQANGGLSIGAQGTDFFRAGDQVLGLTGVLHWSFSGSAGTDAWRVRPTAATPAAFTVANPRPAAPPAVGGAIRAAGFNLLSYFTTIDGGSPICGPLANQGCRGADSAAELARQRERIALVLCALDADVVGLVELENTTPTGALDDLATAVNVLCGGADPYAVVSTGSTVGTDVIRVGLIFRSATLAPAGAPLVDLDPVHSRPPIAQAFDVIDPANPAVGRRFTAIVSHFKSKGGCPPSGGDVDAGDGQGCFNATRTAQANRLVGWTAGTVIPAAGDPDVVLLGDFNSYAEEDPIAALAAGGYVDLADAFGGATAYSYLFDGELGRFDYAFASPSLAPDVAGAGLWHVDADEAPLFDYNDEIVDSGESSFDEKPDGSALAPPRVLFTPASPYRASDHDPVLVGLFRLADLSLTKSAAPNPSIAGADLTYTLTATNAGPSAASMVSLSDPLPAGTTFVSLTAAAGWSCTTPAVGAGGTVSCGIASFGVGSAVFTLVVHVDPFYSPASTLTNVATLASATADPTPGDLVASSAIGVLAPAAVGATKSVAGAFVPGSLVTYTVVLSNAGPAAQHDNAGDEFFDLLPAELTLLSASATSGVATADVPSGTVSWNGTIAPGGMVTITIAATLDYGVADGTIVANQGLALFDGDGDGANEATAATDDPATGTPLDPTEFVVSAPSIVEIPTLDTLGLALLALALAALAAGRIRRPRVD